MTSIAARRRSLGHRIIDADTHLTEPYDLWLRHTPPGRLRERVPQVKTLADGNTAWFIDGDKSINDGPRPNSTIYRNGGKARGLAYTTLTYDDVHPGSYDWKARLKMMDDFGISAQIVYPNILGFGGQNAAQVDADLRLATVQIFNDAMAEIQRESEDRLNPMALLPWWDVDLAVRETERAHGLGLRGININSDPQSANLPEGIRLPDLGETYWDPLWEVCQDKDFSINFHIGGSEQSMDFLGTQGWPSQPREFKGGLGGAMLFFNNGRVLGNIVYSGLLDRYPRLKFVSVESGIGWIPFMLEALDYQYTEITDRGRLQMEPSEYFQRNFHACFWFERKNVAALVRQVGVDNVMFETDFPHPTSLWPIDDLWSELPDLTDAEWGKVMGGNAAKVYNLPATAAAKQTVEA